MSVFSITDLANIALDKAYAKSAGQMLKQIYALSNAPTSATQRALKELDDEATRLEDSDAVLKPDNAVLKKTLDTNEQTLNTTAALIQANDNTIQEAAQAIAIPAVTAKIFSGIAQALNDIGVDPLSPKAIKEYIAQAQRAGLTWNVPAALDFATNYVDSSAWVSKMEGWGAGYARQTKDTILQGVREGWGPKYTAAKMRQLAQGIPGHAAENLTRTLQLTSYRDASAAMEVVNGQYIEGKIRISALKQTSCLSCIALHGTELRPGERVDDHYRGYCDVFYQVAGGPKFPGQMQADSTPGNRRFVKYQSGDEWFNSLPDSRQKAQASFMRSPAKYRAFKDGIPLSEFIGEHTDDVFGRQTPERSLLAMLGGDADKYYGRNQ